MLRNKYLSPQKKPPKSIDWEAFSLFHVFNWLFFLNKKLKLDLQVRE